MPQKCFVPASRAGSVIISGNVEGQAPEFWGVKIADQITAMHKLVLETNSTRS